LIFMPKGLLVFGYEHGIKALPQINTPF